MNSNLIRALLVEDDPDDILLLKESLTEISAVNVKLDCTNKLSDAMTQLGVQVYDVILLDLNLPDSSGLDTLNTIIKKFPRIPVVVISGLADDAITIEAVRRGAQDYLVKSEINAPMLLRILRYAIERKQVETMLRESEIKYRTLVVTNPNGITLTDLDGKLVLCNQQTARLHGYNYPEDMLGMNMYELVAPDDRKLAAQITQKTFEEGRVTTTEYNLLRKDGTQFTAEISSILLCDAEGTPSGYIGITRDITERMRALEAEKRLIKLKEDFMASVSHDLRTPLFSLMGYLDLLRKGKVNDPDVQTEFLTRASTDVVRLLDMVNDLLDFSRLESEHLVLNLQEVDMGPVIIDVLQSFREQAEAKRISLASDPIVPALIAEVDQARMRRVLVNLVENAIKFSEAGGKVAVTGESLNGNIIIKVTDQGCGIPAEDSSRIFEKYYQVSQTLNKNTSGIGLGLYITRQIVEAHGGFIAVKSQLGIGSTFTLTIPVKIRM